MGTILALDKDPLQLELLVHLLKHDRHRAVTTTDPDNAIAILQRDDGERIDLVLVETALPRHDGYRVCREMLQACPDVPLVILSELRDEEQVVRGLLSGADDYIRKPYAPRELLARIQSVLRRSSNGHVVRDRVSHVSVGEVSLDLAQMRAVVNGRAVMFTPREFGLLHALMSNANRVLSRGQLLQMAWGDSFVGAKTVDVVIQRVRRKMHPHLIGGPYIHAVRGYGYRFARGGAESRSVPQLLPSSAPAASDDRAGRRVALSGA